MLSVKINGLRLGTNSVCPVFSMAIEMMCSPVVMGVNLSWKPLSISDHWTGINGEKFGCRTEVSALPVSYTHLTLPTKRIV